MKIKANKIKPGMTIGVKRGGYNSKTRETVWHDPCLVTAVEGCDRVQYTMFNSHECSMGRMVGYLNGQDKVKVYTGKKREKILEGVRKHLFDNYFRAKRDLDLIKLVIELEKQGK